MAKKQRAMLFLGCLLLAAGTVGAYQKPGVLGDIQDFADDLEKGKGVKAKVAALRKKHDELEVEM